MLTKSSLLLAVAAGTAGFTSQKWIKALEKAQQVVADLSFEQKVNFTDLRGDTHGCSGLTFPLPSAGVKEGICFADGPTGINSRYSTQFPAEVTTAATWDRDLFYSRASNLAKEYAKVGANVPLSIVVGPAGRSPYGGRNWEGFSAEPYLAGEAVRTTATGIQDEGITALVKHFYGNEQEWLRIGAPQGGYFFSYPNQTIDSVIDQATARELYVAPFAEAIRAGAGGIMCSYNEIDGTFACENKEVLIHLLKEELSRLAFPGFVLTDWGAGHTTLGSALNATDYVEAGSVKGNIYGSFLGEAAKNGSVPEALLDDKIVRLLTPYFALDQGSLPSIDFNRYVASKDSASVARKIAEESITLLENSNKPGRGLPLKNLQDLILVGSAAAPAHYGILSNLNSVVYPQPYAKDPLSAFTARGQQEDRPVVVDGYFGFVKTPFGQNISYFESKLAYSRATFVFTSAIAMEGFDRTTLSFANNGDNLIKYVADRHDNTIVVISAPGPVDMSQWIEHENVTAVLMTYYSGQEGGAAMANVAFGDVNPSGKLPFTIAKNVSDYDQGAIYNGSVGINPVANFSEGIFVDYKYFDKQGIEPLFEFGYGESYTTFNVSGLLLAKNKKSNPAPVRETNEKLFVNGKQASGLYDYAYTVKATVKNTGSVDGAAVAQLYLIFPDSTPNKMPVHNLRGFAKPFLKAGESQDVYFNLRNKDLTVWSIEKQGWIIPSGEFKVSVGTSSRNLPLSKTFSYKGRRLSWDPYPVDRIDNKCAAAISPVQARQAVSCRSSEHGLVLVAASDEISYVREQQ
ncbi:hypothetical protein JCM10296v2_000737 [Rhodotorula toruloides]